MSNLKSLIDISKDTFCPAPWMEAHISVGGEVLPCCIYGGDNNKSFGNIRNQDNLETVYNSDAAKTLRKELFYGVKAEGCSRCWHDEENFKDSYRLQHLKAWKNDGYNSLMNTFDDFSINPIEVVRLDLRFDNKCNLKCRICSPVYSTSWAKDSKQLREIYNFFEIEEPEQVYSESISESLFESLLNLLRSVRNLFFAGGEPLIQDKHYRILQHAIDNGYSRDMVLTYNTNFSQLTYKNHNVLDYWKHFKKIQVGASLDDSKERGEYQRKNIDWNTIVENRRVISGYENIDFQISPTISVFNVFHILEFIEEWIEQDMLTVTQSNGLYFNILHYPTILNIKNLPQVFKDRIIETYKNFIHKVSNDTRYEWIIPELKKVIIIAESDRTMSIEAWFSKFSNYTDSLDKIRNENFYEIFPEYLELNNEVQNEIANN